MARVKRYESGVVREPLTITPQTTVRGSSSCPACRLLRLPGGRGAKVVGIVTGRDLRFETRMDAPVTDIMTPAERLITVKGAPRSASQRP